MEFRKFRTSDLFCTGPTGYEFCLKAFKFIAEPIRVPSKERTLSNFNERVRNHKCSWDVEKKLLTLSPSRWSFTARSISVFPTRNILRWRVELDGAVYMIVWPSPALAAWNLHGLDGIEDLVLSPENGTELGDIDSPFIRLTVYFDLQCMYAWIHILK